MKDIKGSIFKSNSDAPTHENSIYYEALMNHSRDIIFFTRKKDGRIVETNKAAEAAYGFSRKQLLQMTIYQLYADGYDTDAVRMNPSAAEGSMFGALHQRSDGSIFPVEIRTKEAETGDRCISISIVRVISTQHSEEVPRGECEHDVVESERQLRIMADGLPVMVWVTDENGFVQFVNRAYRSFFGVTKEQVKGSDLRPVLHPNDAAAFTSAFLSCLRERRPFRNQTRVRRADGRCRWVESYGAPYFSTSGDFIGFVGCSPDITEYKQAEYALRESEEKFRTIFRAIPDNLVVTSWDGVILETNQVYSDLLGYTIEEVLGRSAVEIGIWADLKERDACRKLLEAQGFARDFEAHLKAKSGEIKTTLLSVESIVIEGRRCTISIIKDITERKRIEEALRQSERHLRAIFESTDEAIVTLDMEQRCLNANPAAGVLTGVPYEQLAGRTLMEFVDPNFDLSSHWDEYLKTGRFRGEVKIRNNSGNMRIVDATGVAHIGRNIHLFVAHDITERKKAEEALHKAKEELEIRVQERTAKLKKANKALKNYAANLKRLNKELQEFTFAASHDLQEPLRKIQIFGNILLDRYQEPLGEPGRNYLTRLTGAAQRMSNLLRSLLAYSHITTRPNFEKIDLGKAVEDAITDLELNIKDTGAVVIFDRLSRIEADADQIRQLFQNLIGNAIKYRKNIEKPVVRISDTVRKDKCRIVVQDNGIGFEEQYLDRIFKPFQRLHGRESAYDGIGMGLAICRKVVERHNGSITAKSTPGEGSIFTIHLPVRQRKAQLNSNWNDV